MRVASKRSFMKCGSHAGEVVTSDVCVVTPFISCRRLPTSLRNFGGQGDGQFPNKEVGTGRQPQSND